MVGGVAVIKEGHPGGMRKIRCPATGMMAVPVRDAQGREVFQTANGVKYTTRRF